MSFCSRCFGIELFCIAPQTCNHYLKSFSDLSIVLDNRLLLSCSLSGPLGNGNGHRQCSRLPFCFGRPATRNRNINKEVVQYSDLSFSDSWSMAANLQDLLCSVPEYAQINLRKTIGLLHGKPDFEDVSTCYRSWRYVKVPRPA